MRALPRDPLLDATFAFARDPYGYVSRRARELRSDVFETRLLLRRTICFTGPEAAGAFYDPTCFERNGAAPAAIAKTLLGRNGVQSLDGPDHLHRKQMLLDILAPERVAALGERFSNEWAQERARWFAEIPLYPAAQSALTRAVCAWAGTPLAEREAPERMRDLVALFDGAGARGPAHFRARRARRRAEKWARRAVRDARGWGLLRARSACARIARHRERDGTHLSAQVAGVELLNVLRPTVAVSVYLVWIAHALMERPDWRERIARPTPRELDAFVQEVRRFYPFFPAVPARVSRSFAWRGFAIPAGRRALFDLYGTNHDPATWKEPDAFQPERFLQAVPDPFAFVPQGGGDANLDHRCPGEGVALELMKRAAPGLARANLAVRGGDLRIDRSRLPALPRGEICLLPAQPIDE